MKKIKNTLIAAAGIAVLSLVTSCEKSDSASAAPATEDHSGHAHAAENYVCPMHAKISSDKPGKCSECGMDLKKTSGADENSKPKH